MFERFTNQFDSRFAGGSDDGHFHGTDLYYQFQFFLGGLIYKRRLESDFEAILK